MFSGFQYISTNPQCYLANAPCEFLSCWEGRGKKLQLSISVHLLGILPVFPGSRNRCLWSLLVMCCRVNVAATLLLYLISPSRFLIKHTCLSPWGLYRMLPCKRKALRCLAASSCPHLTICRVCTYQDLYLWKKKSRNISGGKFK